MLLHSIISHPLYLFMSFLVSLIFFFLLLFFFFNDTATTEIYTLSLHDALPISISINSPEARRFLFHPDDDFAFRTSIFEDRKSTRLNSSHLGISYAVFCLKKKKKHYPKRL